VACQICGLFYAGARGLGVHMRAKHPVELDDRVRVAPVKRRWSEEEKNRLAVKEAEMSLFMGIEGEDLNTALGEFLHGRSLDAVKSRRRNPQHKELVDLYCQRLISGEMNAPEVMEQESGSGDVVEDVVVGHATGIQTASLASLPGPSGIRPFATQGASIHQVAGGSMTNPRVTAPQTPSQSPAATAAWQTSHDTEQLLSSSRDILSVGASGYKLDVLKDNVETANLIGKRGTLAKLAHYFDQVIPPPPEKTGQRGGPANQNANPQNSRPLSSRMRRVKEFAKIQNLYKKDRSRAIAEVVDGATSWVKVPKTDIIAYWKNLMTVKNDSSPLPETIPQPSPVRVWYPITVKETQKARLRVRAAAGPDGISARQIRAVQGECQFQ